MRALARAAELAGGAEPLADRLHLPRGRVLIEWDVGQISRQGAVRRPPAAGE